MVLSPVYIYDLACIFDLCVYVCLFTYSRTIAHFELMFLLIKPTLNKVYFTLLYFTSRSGTVSWKGTSNDALIHVCVSSFIVQGKSNIFHLTITSSYIKPKIVNLKFRSK